MTVKIKATEKGLLGLDRVSALHSATGWELAANVWAWTYEGVNQHDASAKVQKHSTNSFAGLGIRGLCNFRTVSKYRRAWQNAIDAGIAVPVEPGDSIELPTEEFADYTKPVAVKTAEKPSKPKDAPSVDELADDEINERYEPIELSERAGKFIDRAVESTSAVDESFPGPLGSALQRLSTALVDGVGGKAPQRSYMHALDALVELVAALNIEFRTRG